MDKDGGGKGQRQGQENILASIAAFIAASVPAPSLPFPLTIHQSLFTKKNQTISRLRRPTSPSRPDPKRMAAPGRGTALAAKTRSS